MEVKVIEFLDENLKGSVIIIFHSGISRRNCYDGYNELVRKYKEAKKDLKPIRIRFRMDLRLNGKYLTNENENEGKWKAQGLLSIRKVGLIFGCLKVVCY